LIIPQMVQKKIIS